MFVSRSMMNCLCGYGSVWSKSSTESVCYDTLHVLIMCVLFYHVLPINCCQAHHPSGSTPESMTLPNYLPQHS